jgi:hypothetical protein
VPSPSQPFAAVHAVDRPASKSESVAGHRAAPGGFSADGIGRDPGAQALAIQPA